MNHLSRLLILFTIVAGSMSLGAQTVTDEECMKFHNGTFVDGSLSYVTIVRDSSTQIQTETNTLNGKTSTYSIKWLNACTYELDLIKTNDKQERKASKAMGILRVQITSFDEDGYSYIATAPGMEGPFRGTVKWKKN